jgi:nitrite reductase/ring-hydroxylating ferredoxin subunit
MSKWVRACSVEDVPDGAKTPVDIEGRRLMIVNTGGVLYALDRTCTHEEADLTLGFLMEDIVTCPLHLSRFDAKTGEVLSAPATVPLKTYKVRQEEQDVLVEIPD